MIDVVMTTFAVAYVCALFVLVWVGIMRPLLKERKQRREYRRGTGDRHDPDPGPGTSPVADPGSAGTSFPIPVISAYAIPQRTSAGLILPESTSDVPILAFKHAAVRNRDGVWSLRPAFRDHVAIGPDMDAACGLTTKPTCEWSGKVPNPKHGCGFYGMKNGNHTLRDDGTVRVTPYVAMDVEFSGRVIVAEYGYRAEHQRVLLVHAPACTICGRPAVEYVIIDGHQYAVCQKHPFGQNAAARVAVPVVADALAAYGLPLAESWWDHGG